MLRVADWGSAVVLDVADGSEIVAPATVACGSLLYSPPEIVLRFDSTRPGLPVVSRVDSWCAFRADVSGGYATFFIVQD